jgi:hypothetical protein
MTGILLETSGIDPTTRWLALGAAVLTIAYAVFRPMMKKKDPLAKRQTPGPSLAGQRAVERDMSNLLVELSDMARQITGQLDTRAAKLELLIREADEKIAELRSAVPPKEVSPYAIPKPSVPHVSAREPLPPPAAPLSPEHADVYELADDGKSPREIAAQLGRPDGEIELILALRLAR